MFITTNVGHLAKVTPVVDFNIFIGYNTQVATNEFSTFPEGFSGTFLTP
jgi:hypothetical protein